MAGFVVLHISQEDYDAIIKNKTISEFKQELLKHQEGNVDTFVWCSDICKVAEEMRCAE